MSNGYRSGRFSFGSGATRALESEGEVLEQRETTESQPTIEEQLEAKLEAEKVRHAKTRAYLGLIMQEQKVTIEKLRQAESDLAAERAGFGRLPRFSRS